MSLLEPKPEGLSEEPLINMELKDEVGNIKIKETKEDDVIVEVENKEGRKLVLNHFLPEGYEIRVFYALPDEQLGHSHSYRSSRVYLELNQAKRDGWKLFLVSILHEIGHAVVAQGRP